MATRKQRRRRSGQAGFTMVELLMTAFILAVGLLGLSMLQVMALRAARGSRSMETAVQVAQGVLDQVEMEGRLSWLNLTDSSAAATNANLPNLLYISLPVGNAFTQTYNFWGNQNDTTSADPAVSTPYFTATTTHRADVGAAGGTGQASDFQVVVTFVDAVGPNNKQVPRSVVLTRRIVHG